MSQTSIGILEAGSQRADLVAEHGEFADWFAPFLRLADEDLSFPVWRAHAGDLPEDAEQCDAWLVTGSAASVHEAPDWQAPLGEFLRRAAESRPVIGICYGHQLLHSVWGGRVARHTEWGVGVHEYTLRLPDAEAAEDWMGDARGESWGGTVRLIASHQDQVIEPAPGSVILGGSAFCPVAFSRIGARVLTVQPHPELTRALARETVEMRREVRGDVATEMSLESLAGPIDDALLARRIVDFVRFVRDRDAAVAAA